MWVDYWGGGGGKGYVGPHLKLLGGGGWPPLAPTSSYAYDTAKKKCYMRFMTRQSQEGWLINSEPHNVLNALQWI